MLPGSSGNDDIRTPQFLFDRLHAAFQFDYDAFASHANHLLPTYSTLTGTCSYGDCDLTDQDGLTLDWAGRRVFANPPYSALMPCVEKFVEERNNADIIVVLTKVDTSTRWWQLLAQYAHIDYLPKRIKYEHPNPPQGWSGASFPSAIAIMKKDWLEPWKS